MTVHDYFTKEKLNALGIYRSPFNVRIYNGSEVVGVWGMDIDDFKSIKDESLYRSRGVGPVRAEILIWLRDYLNGKVDGKYEKVKLEPENEEIIRLNEIIERKNDKIREIIAKKAIIEDENRQLKAEIRELKKKESIYLKIKEYFLKEEFLKG